MSQVYYLPKNSILLGALLIQALSAMAAVGFSSQMNSAPNYSTSGLRLKVYLSNGDSIVEPHDYYKNSEEGGLFYYTKETQLVSCCETRKILPEEISYVVAKNGKRGVLLEKEVVFENITGPISAYTRIPEDDGARRFFALKKFNEQMVLFSPEELGRMVEDNREAAQAVRTFESRKYWRYAFIAGGVAMLGTGNAIYKSGKKKDENGKETGGSPIGASMMVVGLGGIVFPLTTFYDDVWLGNLKSAIRIYNSANLPPK